MWVIMWQPFIRSVLACKKDDMERLNALLKCLQVPDCFDIFAVLGCYLLSIGSKLPTFRDNLLVQYIRVKQSKKNVGKVQYSSSTVLLIINR
jgi:hypothetical protein